MKPDRSHSALCTGTVMHQRLQPLRHRLQYRVWSLLLDLDELPTLPQRLRWFSIGRFNLFSLDPRDHGSGDGDLRGHVEAQLRAAGLQGSARIVLMTMPRVLGYAFNPLSVYFCHDADERLRAILYEVNNTFGERHSYLIEVDPAQAGGLGVTQQCGKVMHVSPFLSRDLLYRFRVDAPSPDRAALSLGVSVHDAAAPHAAVLNARLDARRAPLTDTALLRVFFSHPLLTLKVIGAIHWEALRLWLKGARFHPKPAAPGHAVTTVTTIPTRTP